MPDIPVYWLVGTEKDNNNEWIDHSTELIVKAKDSKLDGLDVHWAGLSKQFVQKSTSSGPSSFHLDA